MATITTTVKIWVNDTTRDVLTEKDITEIKTNWIADIRSNRDELYDTFDIWCEDEEIFCADLFFANEETRADYLARFDKHLEERADEYIENEFIAREIEVDIEINAD